MKLSLPNAITLIRLILIPVIWVLFLLGGFGILPYGTLIAAGIFVIAAATDWLDGFLARKLNKVSDIGGFFDSIADKILVVSVLVLVPIVMIYLISTNHAMNEVAEFAIILSLIIVILISLAREFVISALRQAAARKNINLQADKLGKVKAFLQLIAVPALMVTVWLMEVVYNGNYGGEIGEIFAFSQVVTYSPIQILCVWFFVASMALFLASFVMSMISAVHYLVKYRFIFSDKSNPPEENK